MTEHNTIRYHNNNNNNNKKGVYGTLHVLRIVLRMIYVYTVFLLFFLLSYSSHTYGTRMVHVCFWVKNTRMISQNHTHDLGVKNG